MCVFSETCSTSRVSQTSVVPDNDVDTVPDNGMHVRCDGSPASCRTAGDSVYFTAAESLGAPSDVYLDSISCESDDSRSRTKYYRNPYLNFYVPLFRQSAYRGLSAAKVAKEAGDIWSTLSEEDKRPYYKMAARAKRSARSDSRRLKDRKTRSRPRRYYSRDSQTLSSDGSSIESRRLRKKRKLATRSKSEKRSKIDDKIRRRRNDTDSSNSIRYDANRSKRKMESKRYEESEEDSRYDANRSKRKIERKRYEDSRYDANRSKRKMESKRYEESEEETKKPRIKRERI
ncbi:hypothetical protein M8J75_013353 [Diaphorina citri]|nr:hypothetical protein M8J75_013353 [Diaphorina citri]